MKKWKIILASVAAILVLVVTPLSVMAAAGQTPTPTTVEQTSTVHLAIVQPWAVRVGQPMQLTVFERLNQNPIEGAGVWAIAKNDGDAVRQAIQDLQAQGSTITEPDYEAILNARGTLLGATGADGHLTKTFTEPARYWLVALKDGYLPGRSALAVTEALTIDAPQKAAPGEAVTITVNQKGTTDPVSGAGVWAINFSHARMLKDKLAAVRAANRGNLDSVDWDSALKNIAISLGQTDASGQVTQAFDKGRYLLIATKKGCAPSYATLAVAALTPATVTPQ